MDFIIVEGFFLRQRVLKGTKRFAWKLENIAQFRLPTFT